MAPFRAKRLLCIALLTALSCYLLACAAVWVFQSRLLFFPEPELTASPQQLHLPFQTVRLFPLAECQTQWIEGWYVPAQPGRTAPGCVLFCHGNARNIGGYLDIVDAAHRLGMDLFTFDYRGYGNSTGAPSESAMYQDAQTAWRYLVSERGIPPERIIVQGRSLGGGVASWLASRHQPAGLVLESTFLSVPDVAARHLPLLPVGLLCRFRYPTQQHLRTVSCPALFVVSQDDQLIPPAHIRELFATYDGTTSKTLVELRGTHNDCYLTSRQSYEAALAVFYESVLPPLP